ncbi:MAG: hypothetical protein KDI88_14260 [Gammaproteobacteria bacterium]|nr:hypothetical protein [Gammaproteobacteria bacterium]
MKIPLSILAIVAVFLGLFYLLAPPPGPDAMQQRTDLPWQVSVEPDGTSRVFDLHLGRATLADAMAKFGGVEGLAVFEPKQGAMALEAFFGNVQFGPLQAKVIVRLDADEAELATLRDTATRREGSPSGDWKYRLADGPDVHRDRLLRGISYIPGTRGLDAEFFRQRFGEPAAWLQESEQAVSWFYPEIGLSILIDSEAREVLEYRAPRDFVMPEAARTDRDAPAN